MKKPKKYLLSWILTGMACYAFGQSPTSVSKEFEGSAVKWMTFEEAVAKSEKEKRGIFVDVYTDWCGWCKVMDKKTFSEPNVAKVLNEKFYPVKFNAEQREDVVFKGRTFKFVPDGGKGTHQLAIELLNNQLGYPTVVFIDEDLTSVFPMAGYRAPDEFHKYVVFFGEGYYKNGEKAWDQFVKAYKSPYAAQPATTGGKQ